LPTGRRPCLSYLNPRAQPNPGDIRRGEIRRRDCWIRAGQRTIRHRRPQNVRAADRTFRPVITDIRGGRRLQDDLQGRGALEDHREPVPTKQLSLSRLNHWLPRCQAHPEVVQGTAEFHHQIADAFFPQADAVFDDATTLVVYINLADNSSHTKTRDNAPLKPPSAGASPWYQPSFSTNAGSLLWCGYASCSIACGRTTPPPHASRSLHFSHHAARPPKNSSPLWG